METVKQVGYTALFALNQSSTAKVVVNVGGAGSSKSHSIAQLLIFKLTNEQNKVFGVIRKTFPALRMTAMGLILDLLKQYGIYDENKHNKTANTYTYGTNTIWFFSIDEADKIKSTNFNYVWIEEANEISWEEFIILKLRLRAPTVKRELNQIFLSLNPSDATGWIPMKLCGTKFTGQVSRGLDPETAVIHSTFADNPYLDKSYIGTLQGLLTQDENFYRIYTLGEWGLLQRRIYTNYKVLPEMPEMPNAKWCYGLDWGLVNPSAIVKISLFGDKFYVEERLYRAGLTNADIIEFFSHEARGDIYGDPSAKMMVVEIQRAGYSAFEGHKGVKEGIDLCQRQTLYIPQSSVNLIKEIQSYQWKADKDGTILAEPVKFNDHAVDAMRYGIWGITERFGFPTQRPRSTEPIKSLSFKGDIRNKVLERWMKRESK